MKRKRKAKNDTSESVTGSEASTESSEQIGSRELEAGELEAEALNASSEQEESDEPAEAFDASVEASDSVEATEAPASTEGASDGPQLRVVGEGAGLDEAREDFGANPDEVVEIEELEFIDEQRVQSIVESVLFASDKPVSIATLKQAFQGTSVKSDQIRKALNSLAVEYAGSQRGVTLEEVSSGYQLRTKVDNLVYLKNMIKVRPFKLSGPALETLAIIAYKQPTIKHEIDEIRGVESGHLLRALMEKGLVSFAGKSELPGKPMQYQTTRKFLETFSLRNLRELPTLSEIDQLLPEGIGPAEEKKETLDQLTDQLSEKVVESYSTGEDELLKISDQLSDIETTTQFFEDEKARQKAKRDQERAQDLREALAVGEAVAVKDQRWLTKYEAEQQTQAQAAELAAQQAQQVIDQPASDPSDSEQLAGEVLLAEAGAFVSEPSEEAPREEVTDDGKTAEELSIDAQEAKSAVGATYHPEKAVLQSVERAAQAALAAFDDDAPAVEEPAPRTVKKNEELDH